MNSRALVCISVLATLLAPMAAADDLPVPGEAGGNPPPVAAPEPAPPAPIDPEILHGGPSLNCETNFSNLDHLPYSVAEAHFLYKKPVSAVTQAAAAATKAINAFAKRQLGLYFPIVAYDSDHVLSAKYYAESLYGFVGAPPAGLDNPAIVKRLSDLIDDVKTFPQKKQALIDQEVTAELQLVAYADHMATIKTRDDFRAKKLYAMTLQLPKVTDGKVTYVVEQVNDSDPLNLIQIKMDKLKDTIKEIRGTGQNSITNLDVSQASKIKVLETYQNIFRNTVNAHPNVAPNPELVTHLDRLAKTVGPSGNVPHEFQATTEAYQKLKVQQAKRSLIEIVRRFMGGKFQIGRDLTVGPETTGKIDRLSAWLANTTGYFNKARDRYNKFADALTPEQKSALGLTQLNTYATLGVANRWVVIPSAIATIYGSTTLTEDALYKLGADAFFHLDHDKWKQQCATSADEAHFETCALDYLKSNFLKDYILQVEKGKDTVVVKDRITGELELSNAVKKEVDDLKTRRQLYVTYTQMGTDVDGFVTDALSEGDIDGDRWQKNWTNAGVAEKDATDRKDTKALANAYFSSKYPVRYTPKIRDKVMQALDLPYGSDKQVALINEIFKMNDKISNKLSDYLSTVCNTAYPMVPGNYLEPGNNSTIGNQPNCFALGSGGVAGGINGGTGPAWQWGPPNTGTIPPANTK